MTNPAPHQPRTERRLARLTAWAWLWLACVAGWLAEAGGARAPRWLRLAARERVRFLRTVTTRIILARAIAPLPHPGSRRARWRPPGQMRLPPASTVRRLTGCVRRELRGAGLAGDIAALQQALAAPERLIARLVAWVVRGVRLALFAPAHAPLSLGAPSHAHAACVAADSS